MNLYLQFQGPPTWSLAMYAFSIAVYEVSSFTNLEMSPVGFSQILS